MESDINVKAKITSNVQFSDKLLNVIFYVGIIGAIATVLPFVFTIDNDFPFWTVLQIGEIMTSIAEIVFISLISYKIYKDGISKPPYVLLACFAGIIVLDFLVELISDEIGTITNFIYIISSVGAGIILLMSKNTNKIGMWLLLSLAGFIILFAIIFDEFENTNKWIGIALAAIYCYPYSKYLESCQKFLVGDGKE